MPRRFFLYVSLGMDKNSQGTQKRTKHLNVFVLSRHLQRLCLGI